MKGVVKRQSSDAQCPIPRSFRPAATNGLETPGRTFAAKHEQISKKHEEISTHEMAT
jgi:hypothetical protein